MLRAPRLAPVLAAAALAAALAAPGCGAPERAAPADTRPALAVPVEAASPAPWGRSLEATGTVEPARRSSPGTILAGRVTKIERREGDRVRAGEALATIESGDVRARVAQAEAAVVAAQAQADNAKRMRERMERLVARQAASQKNLEDAVAGDDAAQAGLRAAQEGVSAARVQLGYATVTAPFGGVVVRRMIEAGDVVGPGMPLFVVDETARMKVETTVPESAVRQMKPGDPVVVTVDGAGGGERPATLAEVLPAADPATRTLTARILLDNADGALRPGAFARVSFPGGAGTPVLTVPETALVERGPLAGVFVVDSGGVARLRWLTLGASRSGRVEVLTGLDAGESVVTAPPADLTDGRRVQASR